VNNAGKRIAAQKFDSKAWPIDSRGVVSVSKDSGEQPLTRTYAAKIKAGEIARHKITI
jgi:hypothetical protein